MGCRPALAHMLLKRGPTGRGARGQIPPLRKVAAGLVNPLIGPKLNIPMHMGDCLMQSINFSFNGRKGQILFGNSFTVCSPPKNKGGYGLRKRRPRFPSLRPIGREKGILRKTRSQGSVWRRHSGGQRLDFLFLKLSEDILRQAGCWQDGIFEEADWNETKKIVFCEGYRVMHNPWFGHLPFAPAQGEILLWKSPFQLRQAMGPGSSPKRRKDAWPLDMETPRHQVRPDRKWQKRDLEKLRCLTSGLLESSNTAADTARHRDRSPIIGKHEENGKCSFSMASAQEELQPSPLRKAHARFHDRRSSSPGKRT